MPGPFDLTGMKNPRLSWAERLGVAPVCGMAGVDALASAPGEFAAFEIEAVSGGSGLYVLAAQGMAAAAPASAWLAVSGATLLDGASAVGPDTFGFGQSAPQAVTRQGRSTVARNGLVLGGNITSARAFFPVVFPMPLYVPAGSSVGIVCDTANTTLDTVSICWAELP